MSHDLHTLLNNLASYEKKVAEIKETLLTNMVMINELPSPTFGEDTRCAFFINRLTEYGLHNCSTDEVGNGLGLLPGTDGEKNILVVAHLDSLFEENTDHSVTVNPEGVTGAGIADNSVGVATLLTIPLIMEHLNFKLKSNLILMGSSRSLGKGNIEGLRFFLANTSLPICAGLCVEGVTLGRLSYSSIGMMRCEITCKVPEEYDWIRFEASGSIVTINKIISSILGIPLPKEPRTTIVLGSVRGGSSFDTVATSAVLRFEIRSESGKMVKRVAQRIMQITEGVSSLTDAEITFDILAQRKPGGIRFAHPLATLTRDIMKKLKIDHKINPSMSELSAFIDHKIPAVTLGLTYGENMGKPDETIRITPVFKGIAQVLGVILAIDKGLCDEHK